MSLAVTALTFLSVGLALAFCLVAGLVMATGLVAVVMTGFRVLTISRRRAPR